MKKILYILAVLVLPQLLFAQNLDPRVEVTRVYVAKNIDVSKPVIEMAVPDSVLSFDLNFEYTVTENPYRGSYEFRPYAIDVKPDRIVPVNKQLFLRAGAGYSLHPMLDFVYTPAFRSPVFNMNVYGTHRSYFGNYRTITAPVNSELAWDKSSKPLYKGYESYTNAGLNGNADWKKVSFLFDVAYTGQANKNIDVKRSYNAVNAGLRLLSRNNAPKHFHYDVSLSYLLAQDKADYPAINQLMEQGFRLDALMGTFFADGSRILVDVGVEHSAYSNYFVSNAGKVEIAPKYVLRKNRWFVNLGAKLSVLYGNDLTSSMHKTRGQFIYPDVEFAFDIAKNYLNLYIKADGGDYVNTYSSLVERNPYLSLNYSRPDISMPLMDNTVERVNASLGLKGNIASRLNYNLYAGCAIYKNLLFDAVLYDPVNSLLSPAVAYAAANAYYAALDLNWYSKDVEIGAKLKYRHLEYNVAESPALVESAPFTARIDAVYNWKQRIYVGLHADAATVRKALYRLPGYVDLGISAEYRINSKFSVWLYGGNLLNQTIQRVPLYAQRGIYCTAGVTLSL